MAVGTKISNAVAILACDAVVDSLDTGGAGTLEIWEGTPPADVDTAITDGVGGYNLLAELPLGSPAFGGAADAAPGATATANAITDDSSANKTGTAQFFRAKSGSGLNRIQGTCGTSDADLILVTTSIVATQPVEITSWTVTMPES